MGRPPDLARPLVYSRRRHKTRRALPCLAQGGRRGNRQYESSSSLASPVKSGKTVEWLTPSISSFRCGKDCGAVSRRSVLTKNGASLSSWFGDSQTTRGEQGCVANWKLSCPLSGRTKDCLICERRVAWDSLIFPLCCLPPSPNADRQARRAGVQQGKGRGLGGDGDNAGIIVNKAEGEYASAHELRRAVGTGWAKRVMPAVLQRLMRHADIGTTMEYYVSTTADDVADDLWAKFPGTADNTPGACNTSGNILPGSAETAGEQSTQPVTVQRSAD